MTHGKYAAAFVLADAALAPSVTFADDGFGNSQQFRRDIRSDKKQLIASNMRLTDREAEKFWPIYDQFSAELAKIYDRRLALIQAYAQNDFSLTADEATRFLEERVATEQAALQ